VPSHRKRPTSQPTRRPQVAGLRRPGSKPSPRPRPAPYSAQHEDVHVDEQFADGTQEPVDAAPTVDEPEVQGSPADAPESVEVGAAEADEADAVEVAEPEAPPSTRPSPRRKSRDTGVPRPTTEQEIEVAPPIEETGGAQPGPTRRRDEVPFWIAVTLAALLAIGAGLAAWQYFEARGVTTNSAQTDAQTTTEVREGIREAVEKLFSYDYSKLADRDELVNEFIASDKLQDHFTTLNCAVEEQAPKQKLATLTKVSYSAITDLQGDTARALVYVESAWERRSTDQKGSGAGSLDITAQRVDGTWKLAEIDILGGQTGKEPDDPPAKCK